MTQQATVTDRSPPIDTRTGTGGPQAPPPPAGPAPPFSIRAAVHLMLAGALATVVAFMAWIPSGDSARAQARASAGEYGAVAGGVAVAGFWVVVALIGFFSVAAWLWLALANGRGWLWARTTATILVSVFTGFMILTALGAVAPELGAIGAWATVLAWIFGLAAVALLYRRDAVTYYAQVKRP